MAGHTKWSEIRAKAAPEVLAGIDVLSASRQLSGLAAARRLTDEEVADRLHAGWESEPPIIRHRPVSVDALRETVEAMGGNLEIRAIYPDAEYRIDTGEHLQVHLAVRKSTEDDRSDAAWYPDD